MSNTAVLRSAPVESWEDHVEAWHHLGRQVDDAAWGRAAIAASLKGRYGEDAVDRFSEEVGFSRGAIYQFAQTFEAFPEKSTRVDNLTFTHHRHAATLTAGTTEARAAVELAAREGWSANALRAHLRPPALPAPTAETCEAATGACGPVSEKDRAFHVAALVDGLKQSAAVFEAIKAYDLGSLFRDGGTKKSLRELSGQIDPIVEWLLSLKDAIKGRIK